MKACRSKRGSGGGCHPAVALLALLAATFFAAPPPAAAHGVLAGYIQHGVHLKVDAQHIDLTLDLTFFEEPSVRERAVMDGNIDGRISRSEVDDYLKKLVPELVKQVKLRVAGRDLPLILLHDPGIDLASEQTHALAHHRLRLQFFASTPAGLQANDEILVEDQLWSNTKFLGTPHAEGADGCTLLPESSGRSSAAGEPTRESRQFKFRCVKPPTPKPAVAATGLGAKPSQPKPLTP